MSCRPWVAGLACALLAGCSFKPEKIFASYTAIEVREVGRSLQCGSADEKERVHLLPDAQAVLQWQASRGMTLAGPETLAQVPYAVVEMGIRPTGGYGLAVSRAAVLRGDLVILNATFVSPAPGSLRTQALTSPCALVALPAGRYRSIEVQDPTGAVRASGELMETPAPAP
jgi:hypothetical protein